MDTFCHVLLPNLTTKICPIKMKYFSTYYNIPFLYMWIGSNLLLSLKKISKTMMLKTHKREDERTTEN